MINSLICFIERRLSLFAVVMSYLKKHHDQRITASASKGASRSIKGSPTPQKKFSHVKDLSTELAVEEDEDYVEVLAQVKDCSHSSSLSFFYNRRNLKD